MGPGIGGQSHENDVLIAAISDLPAGGDPLGVCVQDDLEQNPGIVCRCAGFVVLISEVEDGEVDFVVDQIVESVLEGAGEDLFVEAEGDEFALRVVVLLVLRHMPSLGEGF